MNIKPGKWRMRNGECAVVEFRSCATRRYPWIGYESNTSFPMCWDDEGKDGASGGTGYLIEPWTDKPVVNWAAMPAWAKWVAMEKDGRWIWYTHKPSADANGYILETGWCHVITREFCPSFTGNWRDSLVERPAA